jgi:hypothetical protein
MQKYSVSVAIIQLWSASLSLSSVNDLEREKPGLKEPGFLFLLVCFVWIDGLLGLTSVFIEKNDLKLSKYKKMNCL